MIVTSFFASKKKNIALVKQLSAQCWRPITTRPSGSYNGRGLLQPLRTMVIVNSSRSQVYSLYVVQCVNVLRGVCVVNTT